LLQRILTGKGLSSVKYRSIFSSIYLKKTEASFLSTGHNGMIELVSTVNTILCIDIFCISQHTASAVYGCGGKFVIFRCQVFSESAELSESHVRHFSQYRSVRFTATDTTCVHLFCGVIYRVAAKHIIFFALIHKVGLFLILEVWNHPRKLLESLIPPKSVRSRFTEWDVKLYYSTLD